MAIPGGGTVKTGVCPIIVGGGVVPTTIVGETTIGD